jgi:hypothetical protein
LINRRDLLAGADIVSMLGIPEACAGGHTSERVIG